MKTLALVTLVLCAAAFAQSTSGAGSMSNEAQPIRITSHPQVATVKPLAPFKTLLETGGHTVASGERPLWEFGTQQTPRTEIPLGDIARILKQQKAAKKATFVRQD